MIKIKILGLILLTLLCHFGFAQTETSDSTEITKSEERIKKVLDEAIESVEDKASKITPKSFGAKKQRTYEKSYFNEEDTISLYTEKFDGLTILDDVVDKYQVFVTGENHTYTESNARIWLKMIKYLHKHAGVRNIMFEYGYSYGYLVNQYLKTGDTTLFSSIDQFAYIEYSNALEELKMFNDSLPLEEKLYFSAIDIERGVYPIVKVLDHLMPNHNEAHDSISLHIQSIKSLAAYNDYKLDEEDAVDTKFGYNRGFNFKSTATLDLVHENFKRFENEYETYLGANFSEFKKVIIDNYNARNTWLKYESSNAVQEYVFRENYMHQRFLEEQNNHPGNWFGQFGRCHTTQSPQNSNSCEWFKFNSLADRIKNTKGGAYSDKVLTIAVIYEDDRNMGHEKDTLEQYFDKYFDEVPDDRMVLLDISKDSILHKGYGSDFNYIFLNTYTDRGEVYNYLDDMSYDEGTEAFKISVAGITQSFSFENLNNVFIDAGNTESFEETLVGVEIMAMGGMDGYYSGLSGGWYKTQEINLANGSIFTLDNFYLKEIFYFNVTKNTKWLNVMPGFGGGYGQLTLKTQESSTDGINSGFLSAIKNTVYKNPAFLLELSGIIDINIGPVSIGYSGGFNFDVSNKRWKSDGELLTNSPKTSMGGLFQTARIGFNF